MYYKRGIWGLGQGHATSEAQSGTWQAGSASEPTCRLHQVALTCMPQCDVQWSGWES